VNSAEPATSASLSIMNERPGTQRVNSHLLTPDISEKGGRMAQRPPAWAGADDNAVATALRTGPFDLALRAAIESRGLTLDRLRTRLAQDGLRVAVTTLSYWQRGLRRPERPESLRVVSALEGILGLPPHSLTVLLGPRRPRGAAVRSARWPHPYAEIMRLPGDLTALLAELDSPAAGKLQVVSEYNCVTVGPGREMTSLGVRLVVRSHHDGVDRALVIYDGEPGEDMERAEITAGDSCRLGRLRRDPIAGAVAAELLFDRTIRLGETHLFSYGVRTNTDRERTEYVGAFRFPAGQYVLRVRFDPAALPVQVHRFTARFAGGEESETAELTLDADHAVHLVETALPPGTAGIRWAWS
jgi:hypothetical protein